MRKHRKIKKEDIGDPSNFVHVKHVGFGQKKSSLASIHNQRSLDLGGESEREVDSEANSPAILPDQVGFPIVERRARGSRSSLIPRHHRSTTTCIFPDNEHHLQNHLSTQSPRNSRGGVDRDGISPDKQGGGGTLKPTFGSLLNLSFLPLGLGKSSSKSPSMGKTKRMSLLNLTASNLFAGQKVQQQEQDEGKGAPLMTGYTRRRSFSRTRENDGGDDKGNNGTLKKQIKENKSHEKVTKVDSASSSSSSKENEKSSPSTVPTRIPLAKLGRSKSTMADFTKRPKLRLKIVPPVAPPPPVPVLRKKSLVKDESLPSPPPSPLPSPPKTPTSAPPIPPPPLTLEEEKLAEHIVRRIPKSPPRSRIILLPSSPSVDSLHPVSPLYLTPTGGLSPLPTNVGSESSFPLLSPTTPPTSTPFNINCQRNPGTPPVWPLQPVWPTSLSLAMQQTEPTIPEIPSPAKEEMDTLESEYEPVASIIDSFLQDEQESMENATLGSAIPETGRQSIMVCPDSLKVISTTLQDAVPCYELPKVIAKLLNSSAQTLSAMNEASISPERVARLNVIQSEILTRTLELWMEVTDSSVGVDELAKIMDEENQQAADALRKICLSDNDE